MKDYILKRLLLMIPTLFGIILLAFLVTQLVPGSFVESRMSIDQGIKSDRVIKQDSRSPAVSTNLFTRGVSYGSSRS